MRLKIPALVMVSLGRACSGVNKVIDIQPPELSPPGKANFFYEISQTLADCAVVS